MGKNGFNQEGIKADLRGSLLCETIVALRFLRLAGGELARFAAYFAGYGRTDITAQTIRENVGFFITQALDKLAVEE